MARDGGEFQDARWRVEISQVVGNERLLRDVLLALEIDIVEGNTRFLVSRTFEVLDTAADVQALVTRVQITLAEVARRHAEIAAGFSIGRIIENRAEGPEITHVIVPITGVGAIALAGAMMAASGYVGLSPEEVKRLEEQRIEQEYQQLRRTATALVVSAFRDVRARQVQRLLDGDPTPKTIGDVADLIEADIGELTALVSDKQLTRFRRSINHPDIFGEDARHIVSAQLPPPNPMTLDEARAFIRDLAQRWFERKAGF
jgi:hypothetical protein